MEKLLGDNHSNFNSLNNLEKTLGSELWEDDFGSLLSIVKEFLVDVWESRKLKLYGDNTSWPPGGILVKIVEWSEWREWYIS